jgi:elongation factor G
MGTLHLEVKRHRMERDFRLKIRVGKPLVSYRETLRKPIRIEGECDRYLGGKQLFARLCVEFDNRRAEQPVTVISKLKPGILTPNFQTAAENELRSALQTGEFGNPLLNVQATIVDGQMDPVNSDEAAFAIAAADAVRKALAENVLILEPIMKVNVTTPSEFLGNVISDLGIRRGEITNQALHGAFSEVIALVPLIELFDYADRVRSLTQGRASSTMEPQSYAPAPAEVLRSFKGEI